MKSSVSQLTPARTVVTSFNPRTTAASQLRRQQLQEKAGFGNDQNKENTNNKDDADEYFDDGDWVLCVTSSSQWVSCALSNGEVQVYDRERLLQLQEYQHPTSHVTDLATDVKNPNLLVASAADGTVTLFDIRQQQPAYQVKLPRPEEEALSVSLGFDGAIAAVGSSRAKIHFFDLRDTRTLLGTYNQSHTGEVTRVRFQTLSSGFGGGGMVTTTPILISAAEDGLSCIFDTSQSSEEVALKNVLTVQSPVREVGFFGPQSDAVFVLTGSETLQLYHKDDSTCRKDFGLQFRNNLNSLIGNSNNDTPTTPSIDYLVDCHWDTTRQELLLLAGNANGDANVFRVQENDISMVHHLQGGHRGVVRAWHPLTSNEFVTVGEDARMCEWRRITHQAYSATGSTTTTTSSNSNSTSNTINNNKNRTQTQIILPTKKKTTTRSGGGKSRRVRSRMAASPY